jgi:hypothetical protein
MSAPNRIVVPLIIGAVLAATASTDAYAQVPEDGTWMLVKAYEVPQVAAAAHASNYETTTIYGSDNSTAAGARNTSTGTGSSHVAGTARAFTLVGGSNLEFAAGATVKANVAQAASGVAVNVQVYLVFEKVRT